MILILMGVSGSGKTTVGHALAQRLGWIFEDGDDWHSAANIAKMRSGHELTDEDRAPWLRALNEAILNWIAEKKNVVLACSALKAAYRAALGRGAADAAFRFVYLKVGYGEIKARLDQRKNHFMPESLLKSQFETLVEPDASEALTVDAAQPVANVVEAILSGVPLQAR